MTSPLKVGDLVRVVKGCPICSFRGGYIFTIEIIVNGMGGFFCTSCLESIHPAGRGAHGENVGYIPLSWLRRIPPLGELEEHKEVIKETV